MFFKLLFNSTVDFEDGMSLSVIIVLAVGTAIFFIAAVSLCTCYYCKRREIPKVPGSVSDDDEFSKPPQSHSYASYNDNYR